MLSWNNLTDLSSLYISEALKVFKGIRGIDLSHNNLSSRSGEYLGDAITPDYKVGFLIFKGNNLELTGVWRIIESVSKNLHVKMLDLGFISDEGLKYLVELLKDNTSLERLRFQENPEKPFTEPVMEQFCEFIKNSTIITEINIKLVNK